MYNPFWLPFWDTWPTPVFTFLITKLLYLVLFSSFLSAVIHTQVPLFNGVMSLYLTFRRCNAHHQWYYRSYCPCYHIPPSFLFNLMYYWANSCHEYSWNICHLTLRNQIINQWLWYEELYIIVIYFLKCKLRFSIHGFHLRQ